MQYTYAFTQAPLHILNTDTHALVHKHSCTHALLHKPFHTHMLRQLFEEASTSRQISMLLYIHICIYIYTCAYIYRCICICTVYMYIYICTVDMFVFFFAYSYLLRLLHGERPTTLRCLSTNGFGRAWSKWKPNVRFLRPPGKFTPSRVW